jgi:hypothetical protein
LLLAIGLHRREAGPDFDMAAGGDMGSEFSEPERAAPQRAPEPRATEARDWSAPPPAWAEPAGLTVGAAHDRAERDADRVADVVIQRLIARSGTPGASAPMDPREPPAVHGGHAAHAPHAGARRSPAPAAPHGSPGAGRPIGLAGGTLDGGASTEITLAAGGGRPLSPYLRREFGSALGADVSGARVHDDERADRLARRMSATAFTVGRDMYFSRGAYQPDRPAGAHLLAHELAHVVQSSGGAAGGESAGGAARSIRRKVGFELEDSNWESYQIVGERPIPSVEDKTETRSTKSTMERSIKSTKEKKEKRREPEKELEKAPEKEKERIRIDNSANVHNGASSSNAISSNAISSNAISIGEDPHWQRGPQWDDGPQTHLNPLYRPPRKPGGRNLWDKVGDDHIDSDVKRWGAAAFTKKDKLHKGDQWDLESDGPYVRGVMDIEFVTKPFDESPAGLKALKVAFKQMAAVMAHLTSMKDPMPRAARAGGFFGPEEHHLNNPEVLLSAGSRTSAVKMQVTHGIQMEDIPTLFETFGTPGGDESKKDAKNREGAWQLLPDEMSLQRRVMAAAPQQARWVVSQLEQGDHIWSHETAKLLGFFTYALSYAQWIQILPWKGIKEALPMMSRYDFASLFKNLPPADRAGLTTPDGKAAVRTAFLAILQHDGIRNEKRKTPLESGPIMEIEAKLPKAKQDFYELVGTLTTGQWIDGVLQGTDRLTAAGIYEFWHGTSRAKGDQADDFEKSLHVFSRGHGATKSLVDGDPELAIMENRAITPVTPTREAMTIEQAEKVATSYLEFLISLRAGKPSFPKMKLG